VIANSDNAHEASEHEYNGFSDMEFQYDERNRNGLDPQGSHSENKSEVRIDVVFIAADGSNALIAYMYLCWPCVYLCR